LNSPLPSFSFILPPPLISTPFIFPFTYMCIQYLHHIHPKEMVISLKKQPSE
jgi:hypothetical protein